MAEKNFLGNEVRDIQFGSDYEKFIFVEKNEGKEYSKEYDKNYKDDNKVSHYKKPHHGYSINHSLSDVVESIGVQENGLANILESEALKVCKSVEIAECIDDLIKVNKSVKDTIRHINNIQLLLLSKLEIVSDICDGCYK